MSHTEQSDASVTNEEITAPKPTAASASELSELRAMVERLAKDNDAKEQRNHELMVALLNAQAARAPEPEAELATYKLTNVCGANVSFYVTDPKTTHQVHIYLEGRGTYRMLTEDQIRELQDKAPSFFEDGIVTAPDVIQPSANVIPDIGAWIDSLDVNSIPATVAKLTAKGVLHDIHNYVENKRFRSHDENGNQYLDSDKLPEMRAVQLDIKSFAVLHAVAEQLSTKNGIQPVIS